MENADYYSPISRWDCAKKFYAVFQITGTQLPVVATLLISVERMLAVHVPVWYSTKFSPKYRSSFLLFSILFCAVSLTIYFLTVWPLQQNETPWGNCALTFSSSPAYNTAHKIFITTFQLFAFCLSFFALTKARRKSRAVAAMKREVQDIKPIFGISIVSVILVTAPQIFLISLELFNNYIAAPIVFLILLLPCVNSFMNIFIYLGTTKEFRRQIVGIIRCGKSSAQANILANSIHIQSRNVQPRSNVKRLKTNQIRSLAGNEDLTV